MYLFQNHKCYAIALSFDAPAISTFDQPLWISNQPSWSKLSIKDQRPSGKGNQKLSWRYPEVLFSLIILLIYEKYIFASLFKVWWFPRAPWRDLIGNSNLPSRRSTQLFLVFARRLRLLSLPFLSFFRTICYFLTVIHLAEIAISGFWKWRIKKTCFILMRSIISFQVCGCLYFI